MLLFCENIMKKKRKKKLKGIPSVNNFLVLHIWFWWREKRKPRESFFFWNIFFICWRIFLLLDWSHCKLWMTLLMNENEKKYFSIILETSKGIELKRFIQSQLKYEQSNCKLKLIAICKHCIWMCFENFFNNDLDKFWNFLKCFFFSLFFCLSVVLSILDNNDLTYIHDSAFYKSEIAKL